MNDLLGIEGWENRGEDSCEDNCRMSGDVVVLLLWRWYCIVRWSRWLVL